MREVEIAVVGAGPGGLAAATAAAEAGASVLVLDEYGLPGGQYYRQPGQGLDFHPGTHIFDKVKDGRARIEKARQAGVEFISDALVWGAFADGSVSVYVQGRSEVLKPAKLVLATGAFERLVAFPGWTLPGVITVGAAQAMLKGQGVLPGHRIVMAGTGPLQVAVAAQLVEAGARLLGVLEGSKSGDLLGSGRRFLGQWGRLGEGVQYWRTLRAAKVPITLGRTVVRAEGESSVTRVTTAALDDQWRPVPGAEQELEVDAICTGFGLIPNTRLARLLGCETVYDPARGGHVPIVDSSMQASKAGVFVVGEAAGIAGAKAAELQGTIAGVSAALQLGKGSPAAARRQIEGATRALRSEMSFARSLNEVFAPRAGVLDLLTEDTVLCRCEEVTVGEVLNGRPDWMDNLDAVRTVKRTGMGNCQGAMCEALVAQLLARETGKPLQEIGTYHVRPPLKPVPVEVLADLNQSLGQPATTAAH